MTSKDAFIQICKCSLVILTNTWNSINKAAHKYPWVFIISILIGAIAISVINIGQARAERDNYNKQLIEVQQSLDSAKCIINNIQK